MKRTRCCVDWSDKRRVVCICLLPERYALGLELYLDRHRTGTVQICWLLFSKSCIRLSGLGTLPGRSDFPRAVGFLDTSTVKRDLPYKFWDLGLPINYVECEGLRASIASLSCVCDDSYREIYVLY